MQESQKNAGRSEDEEQARLVAWYRKTYPHLIYAIPNGGKRNIVTATKMKATGTLPGVPDLHIPALNLWIEMKKAQGGSVSVVQKIMHDYLRSIGHTVIIGRGFEHARDQILEIMQ